LRHLQLGRGGRRGQQSAGSVVALAGVDHGLTAQPVIARVEAADVGGEAGLPALHLGSRTSQLLALTPVEHVARPCSHLTARRIRRGYRRRPKDQPAAGIAEPGRVAL